MASTWVLSIKLLLISTGFVSISMLIKLVIPFVTHFVCYKVPLFWYFVVSLLRPPYLYLVINVIIMVIAATSRFHNKSDEESGVETSVLRSNDVLVYDNEVVKSVVVSENDDIHKVVELRESVVSENDDVDEIFALRDTRVVPHRTKSLERLPEKPLVTKTFVAASKTSSQAFPGGRSVTMQTQNENDTLDNTWKTITKSNHTLTKCDTSKNMDRPSKPLAVQKSTTFRDRTNYNPTVTSSQSPVKEPSLDQDELNKKVEAFIKKFQDEMRLQRQESIMEMIKRGAR